jgi:hypothetical protein
MLTCDKTAMNTTHLGSPGFLFNGGTEKTELTENRLFAKSPCLFGRGWGFQPQAVIGESCPNHLFKRTDFWQTV